MNMTQVIGLTETQKTTLRLLGAIESEFIGLDMAERQF